MKKKIYFSIITPVLNGERYIKKNIDSLKKQTFKNFEHIIVDGKSTDNTLKIIKRNKNKRISIISKKDKNLWEAINNGIKVAKGEVIAVLNSDDYFYKNALKIIFNYFKKDKSLSYVFGSIKKNNRTLYRFEKNKIYYKFNIYPSHSVSFFIKKKIHKKIGYYNSSYNFCADYDFFYKLFNNKNINGQNTKKNEIIGYFRPGGISEKISKFKKIFIEFKIRFKNNQNLIVLFFVIILTVMNIYRNIFLKFFNFKKK
mgnify:CR=1 FL=1